MGPLSFGSLTTLSRIVAVYPQQRDDLIGEGAVAALKASRTWDRRASLETYARWKAWSAMKDYVRREARWHDAPPAQVQTPRPDLDVEDKDQIERLLSCLSTLERLVVRAYDLEGIGLTDIGKAYGCTKGSLSEVRSRALKRMRQYALTGNARLSKRAARLRKDL